MNEERIRTAKGQILVLVVLMMLGLLGMLALVLDGGNLYSQRRQAQLAADAGALAGARALCDSSVTVDPDVAANQYVTANYATMSGFNIIGEYEVEVEASIDFDTFFLHILGRPQLTATAIAAAKCETGGYATVLPVAWSCRPPNYSFFSDEPGPGCQLAIDNIDSDCTYPSEDPDHPENWDKFYIIFDSSSLSLPSDDPDGPSLGIYCAENDYPDYGNGFTCDNCDDPDVISGTLKYAYCHSDYPKCDLNCDGVTDLEFLSQSTYGWLDLDEGPSADLVGWVEGDDVPTVETHHWYSGKPGMEVDVLHAVGNEVLLEKVVVPVFDHMCPKNYEIPGPTNEDCVWHESPPDDWQDFVVESGGDDYFHIIGFANYKVTCIQTGSGPYPKDSYDGKNCEINWLLEEYYETLVTSEVNIKSIEGCFVQGVDTDIGGYGSQDFEAYTLRLSK